ncbi:MAG TPA: hypothetical protein VIM10_06415 [Actinopolymorphaceae bacterium]
MDGSVAGGLERPDSDLDLVLIVTDEAFQRALDADRLSRARRTRMESHIDALDVRTPRCARQRCPPPADCGSRRRDME